MKFLSGRLFGKAPFSALYRHGREGGSLFAEDVTKKLCSKWERWEFSPEGTGSAM